MRIVLNGEPCDVTSTCLDQVLLECGYEFPAVATALNEVIVHKQDRAEAILHPGDRLEIVTPIGGG